MRNKYDCGNLTKMRNPKTKYKAKWLEKQIQHPRAYFAGFTDYTAMSLSEIVLHFKEWHMNTENALFELCKLRANVLKDAPSFEDPAFVFEYIDHFRDFFIRYLLEFERLIKQLSKGVNAAHVTAIKQLYDGARREDSKCIAFRDREINRGLKNDNVRYTLDKIYTETRSLLIDYYDLSNVQHRLNSLIDAEVNKHEEVLPGIDLKPNFMGIGLNLNKLIRNAINWFTRRR